MLRIATVRQSRAFARQRENHNRIFFRLWHEPCLSVPALLAAEQPSTARNTGPSYWFFRKVVALPLITLPPTSAWLQSLSGHFIIFTIDGRFVGPFVRQLILAVL